MPVDVNKIMKPRDVKTLRRFEMARKQADILKQFFNSGFRKFEALSAITLNYYPEIPESRLSDFWHFRNIDEDICVKLEDVFEKLKQE